MRIGCLQFAPQVGDVDNNLNRADAVLKKANPHNLDLLVLPELAFTGYNYKSLQQISPFLEHKGSGITSLWARTVALKHECVVAVGYPETVDVSAKWPTGPEYYNALLVINKEGETVANYRKTHLYYTDETWALEGPDGFYSGVLPELGRTSMGICMDINPYRFEAPWHAFEFANHVLKTSSNLVIVSMAWLTQESGHTFSRTPNEPDMETLTYWVSRLEPIIRAEKDKETIVVLCNRCGSEGEAIYAGTSAVLGVKNGEVNVYGLLGRGDKELLVVDTDDEPYGQLVHRPASPNVAAGFSSNSLPEAESESVESATKLSPIFSPTSATSMSSVSPISTHPDTSASFAGSFSSAGKRVRPTVPPLRHPGAFDSESDSDFLSPGFDVQSPPTPSAPSPIPSALRPKLQIPKSGSGGYVDTPMPLSARVESAVLYGGKGAFERGLVTPITPFQDDATPKTSPKYFWMPDESLLKTPLPQLDKPHLAHLHSSRSPEESTPYPAATPLTTVATAFPLLKSGFHSTSSSNNSLGQPIVAPPSESWSRSKPRVRSTSRPSSKLPSVPSKSHTAASEAKETAVTERERGRARVAEEKPIMPTRPSSPKSLNASREASKSRQMDSSTPVSVDLSAISQRLEHADRRNSLRSSRALSEGRNSVVSVEYPPRPTSRTANISPTYSIPSVGSPDELISMAKRLREGGLSSIPIVADPSIWKGKHESTQSISTLSTISGKRSEMASQRKGTAQKRTSSRSSSATGVDHERSLLRQSTSSFASIKSLNQEPGGISALSRSSTSDARDMWDAVDEADPELFYRSHPKPLSAVLSAKIEVDADSPHVPSEAFANPALADGHSTPVPRHDEILHDIRLHSEDCPVHGRRRRHSRRSITRGSVDGSVTSSKYEPLAGSELADAPSNPENDHSGAQVMRQEEDDHIAPRAEEAPSVAGGDSSPSPPIDGQSDDVKGDALSTTTDIPLPVAEDLPIPAIPALSRKSVQAMRALSTKKNLLRGPKIEPATPKPMTLAEMTIKLPEQVPEPPSVQPTASSGPFKSIAAVPDGLPSRPRSSSW